MARVRLAEYEERFKKVNRANPLSTEYTEKEKKSHDNLHIGVGEQISRRTKGNLVLEKKNSTILFIGLIDLICFFSFFFHLSNLTGRYVRAIFALNARG